MRLRALANGLAIFALLASGAPTASSGPETGVPSLSLKRTSPKVTAFKYGRRAELHAPVYLQARDAPLDLRVRRSNYTAPLTLHQVLHRSEGNEWVERPSPV